MDKSELETTELYNYLTVSRCITYKVHSGEAFVYIAKDKKHWEVSIVIHSPSAQFNIIKWISAHRALFNAISVSKVNSGWHYSGVWSVDTVIMDPLEENMGYYEDTKEYRKIIEGRIYNDNKP